MLIKEKIICNNKNKLIEISFFFQSRYSVLSMCFKSDKHTLETRNELLKKQREQAELNANKEIAVLTLAANVSNFFYFKKK